MTKKEKFVKLVELESKMKAQESPYFRSKVTANVYCAMELEESLIPDDKDESLLYAVKEYVKYQMDEDEEKPDWLK